MLRCLVCLCLIGFVMPVENTPNRSELGMFKRLIPSALEDINKAQPNLFSGKTKALYQELQALRRS